jgi:hypothetical protein
MIPALFLVVLAVVYRIATGLMIHSGAGWLSNFAPLAAIALCGAVYFPPKLKFSVPLVALFISDEVLNYYYGAPLLDPQILCRYLTLALIGMIGLSLQRRASLKTLLPASIAGSTIFYLITNAFSWLSDPGYVKNLAGFIQAITVGLPQYSTTPTWMFFRNSLLSDLCFTLLFVACISYGRNSARARAAVTLPRVA